MANKSQFIYEVVLQARRLAAVFDVVDERHKAFFDNGFQSGGANEIVQADIDAANIPISVADLTAGITLLEQVANFKGNSAVTQADYMATVNKLRDGHSGS